MPVHWFERMQVHEQQKVRLGEQETRLNAAEREARTRQLIEAGGVILNIGQIDFASTRFTARLVGRSFGRLEWRRLPNGRRSRPRRLLTHRSACVPCLVPTSARRA